MSTLAQQNLTPEMLWQLGRVSPLGISKDGKLFKSTKWARQIGPKQNEFLSFIAFLFKVERLLKLKIMLSLLADKNVSSNGKQKLISQEVKVEKILGTDIYPELTKKQLLKFILV